jgi:transcriptional regulator with XRE-family HTH domain
MLGETLRRLRGIYGYNATEMSKLLGISNSYLSELERGKKKVSLDLLDRYADVFGIRASTLMRFSEEYEGAVEQNRAQLFITNMMSKLIEFYGERYEASD